MKRISIIGYGQLGKECFATLRRTHLQDSVMVYRHDAGFDATDEKTLDSIVELSDVVINCAAMTDVNACETDMKKAIDINYLMPKKLAKRIKSHLGNKRLVHISTDFVYGTSMDDKAGMSLIDEPCDLNPCNFYGKTKAYGEEAVIDEMKYCENSLLVLRPSYLFGEYGTNSFVRRTIDALLASRINKISVKVVNDQFIYPTSCSDVCNVISMFIDHKMSGDIYNVRCLDAEENKIRSKYDIAKYIQSLIGGELEETSTSELYNEGTGAVRQKNSALSVYRLMNSISKYNYYERSQGDKQKLFTWQDRIEHICRSVVDKKCD